MIGVRLPPAGAALIPWATPRRRDFPRRSHGPSDSGRRDVTTELALPEPQSVTLTQVASLIVPRAQAARALIRERRDVAAADEMRRQLEAYRHYLTDKASRDLVMAETRRTEVLIGHLLGLGEKARSDSEITSDISKEYRHLFRQLAANEERVEQLLALGRVTRKFLLDAIAYGKPPAPVETPLSIKTLHPGKCATFVADPPWRYGNTATRASAQGHYDTLSIAQLCGDELLPDGSNLIKEVVRPKSADRAHLYLWTTAGHLPDAFRVMEAWGFTYKTYLVWVKPQMGMGNYFRVSTELVLFGIRGEMRTRDMGLMNWFEAKRGKHSAKPQKFYDLVVKASPGPYLELFSRCDRGNQLEGTCQCSRCRLGWEVWGNQA